MDIKNAESFMSGDCKVNQSDDMVRVILYMKVNEYQRFRSFFDNEKSKDIEMVEKAVILGYRDQDSCNAWTRLKSFIGMMKKS